MTQVQQQTSLYQQYVCQQIIAILSCLRPDHLRSQPHSRSPLASCSARILQRPLSHQTNRATTHTASTPPRRLTARSSRRRHPQQQTAPHRRTARPSAHPRLASTRTRCAKSETRVTRRSSSTRNSPAQRTPHRRVHEVAPAGHKDAGHQRLRHQQEHAAEDRYGLRCIAHLIRADVPEAIGILADIHKTQFMKSPNSEKCAPCSLKMI